MKKDVVIIGLIVIVIGFIMWMTPLGRTPLDHGVIAGPFEISGFFIILIGLGILGYGFIAKKRT